MKKTTKTVLQTFGSLKLAIFLILSLAVVCSVATFYESAYGTAAAQYSIYKTSWFGVLLLIIGLNVSCAALKKFPWKHHQVGFVLTHIGIVTVVAGSFISYQWGIDAQMPIYNEQEEQQFLLPQEKLEVVIPEQKKHFVKVLELGPYERNETIASFDLSKDIIVGVDRFYPFAGYQEDIFEQKDSPHQALQLRFKNKFVNNAHWLYLGQHNIAEANLGPAKISFEKIRSKQQLKTFLKKAEAKKKILGEIKLKVNGLVFQVPFYKSFFSKTIHIKNTPYKLKNIKYFSDAAVENNKLVDRSDKPRNPAIKLDLVGDKGSQPHVAFALFPDFPSTHQKNSLYGAKIEFISQDQLGATQRSLQVGVFNHKLYYRVSTSKGIQSARLKVGKSYKTGWMDLNFKVEAYYAHAEKKISYRSIQVKNPDKAKVPAAVRFFFKKGNQTQTAWVAYSETKQAKFAGQLVKLSYAPSTQDLGFSIYLNKFTMNNDPGTLNPASYQSDVVLKDPSRGLSQSHIISMNEPLTYKGYTFYQSSYLNDDNGNPIGTVLSVGYDPGRFLKYGGSIILVLGILLMFFFRKAYMQAYQNFKSRKGQ